MIAHLGLTGKGFAEKLQVPKGRVESYLTGNHSPNIDFVTKVCNLFKITSDQLLKQKLTEADLKGTGSIKSVTEVQLEEALKRIELLENTVKDKDRIIELMQKKTS